MSEAFLTVIFVISGPKNPSVTILNAFQRKYQNIPGNGIVTRVSLPPGTSEAILIDIFMINDPENPPVTSLNAFQRENQNIPRDDDIVTKVSRRPSYGSGIFD